MLALCIPQGIVGLSRCALVANSTAQKARFSGRTHPFKTKGCRGSCSFFCERRALKNRGADHECRCRGADARGYLRKPTLKVTVAVSVVAVVAVLAVVMVAAWQRGSVARAWQ